MVVTAVGKKIHMNLTQTAAQREQENNEKIFLRIIFFTIFSFSFGKMQAAKYRVKDVQGIALLFRGNEPFTGMVADERTENII